jgi:hypothetical protein
MPIIKILLVKYLKRLELSSWVTKKKKVREEEHCSIPETAGIEQQPHSICSPE